MIFKKNQKTRTSSKIKAYLDSHTTHLVDKTAQKFRLYPRWIIWLILFLSYNVLAQGIADVILKVIGYTPIMSPLPLRIDFLFLTAVSVMMGYQALKGMRRRELDVTRNSISLGLLVESGLVIGDISHIIDFSEQMPELFWIRLPFIILTTINFFILFYISTKLRLFRDENGKFILA